VQESGPISLWHTSINTFLTYKTVFLTQFRTLLRAVLSVQESLEVLMNVSCP